MTETGLMYREVRRVSVEYRLVKPDWCGLHYYRRWVLYSAVDSDWTFPAERIRWENTIVKQIRLRLGRPLPSTIVRTRCWLRISWIFSNTELYIIIMSI